MNSNKEAASRYEKLKVKLARKYSDNRIAYTDGKRELIIQLLREAYHRGL